MKLGEQFKLNIMQPEMKVTLVKQMKTCSIVEHNLVGEETTLDCTRLVELMFAHKERRYTSFYKKSGFV